MDISGKQGSISYEWHLDYSTITWNVSYRNQNETILDPMVGKIEVNSSPLKNDSYIQ